MPIAVELRTTCERCRDPLPLNAFADRITCWACLHENPVSPEEWAALLRGALEDAWSREPGEGVTETRKVGRRTFDLRWSVAKRAEGARRRRPREMRADLFPGVVALAGEEAAAPPTARDEPFTCPQCGGALSIDGRSREVTCPFCQVKTMLSDETWRRLHPVHAQRAWFLVLEDDEGAGAVGAEEPADAADKGAAFPRFAIEANGDVIVGPDGLLYATVYVAYGRSSVCCLDADLRVRWRTDTRRSPLGPLRLAVVGDAVWLLDSQKHAIRRFNRADGKDLGKIGGVEPAGAAVHHLDGRSAYEMVGCADRTVLLLFMQRFARYDADGRGVPTWPPVTGFWGWFSKDKPTPLYAGPPEPEDRDAIMSMRPMYAGGVALGEDRPAAPAIAVPRGVAGPDGDLWLFTGSRAHRYGPDGKRRWTAELGGEEDAIPIRPGLDGERNLYAITRSASDKLTLQRISPDGKPTRLREGGFGQPAALAVTAEGRILVFGREEGDVRVLDRDGAPLRASAAAVDADREAAEWEE